MAKLQYKVSEAVFKSAKTMLSKASIELIFDDYEIHAVDCLDNGKEYSVSTLDQRGMTKLYKQLLDIYSSRIDETLLKASKQQDEYAHIQL